MTLQCAPCLSDLALVRDAVTSIGGTATCTAHAVLMRYPSDDPGRRRRRLADLRTLAESRVVDATGSEKDRLELLVQEYAVAEAMDLGAPDRTGPGRGHEPRSRRDRGGRERRPGEPPREHREPREGREGRPREPRPDRGPAPESAPAAGDTPSTVAVGEAPAADVPAAEGGIPASSDRPAGVPSTPESGPESTVPAAGGESAPSSPPAESAPTSPPAESAPSNPSVSPPSYVGNAAPSSPPPAGEPTTPAQTPPRDDGAAGSSATS